MEMHQQSTLKYKILIIKRSAYAQKKVCVCVYMSHTYCSSIALLKKIHLLWNSNRNKVKNLTKREHFKKIKLIFWIKIVFLQMLKK